MKKALFAPLCSGFIIPGLGQIINGHLKKGVLILAALSVLFGLGVYRLYRMVGAALDKAGRVPSDVSAFMERLRAEDPSALWLLAAGLTALWLYSVLDAAVAGRRIDRLDRGDSA
jgi:TM2 domain-containing membrane protein YozV